MGLCHQGGGDVMTGFAVLLGSLLFVCVLWLPSVCFSPTGGAVGWP